MAGARPLSGVGPPQAALDNSFAAASADSPILRSEGVYVSVGHGDYSLALLETPRSDDLGSVYVRGKPEIAPDEMWRALEAPPFESAPVLATATAGPVLATVRGGGSPEEGVTGPLAPPSPTPRTGVELDLVSDEDDAPEEAAGALEETRTSVKLKLVVDEEELTFSVVDPAPAAGHPEGDLADARGGIPPHGGGGDGGGGSGGGGVAKYTAEFLRQRCMAGAGESWQVRRGPRHSLRVCHRGAV